MTRRLFIGPSGGQFLFRASQPGVDAVTGDLTRMATFEAMLPVVPKAQGIVDVPALVASGGGHFPGSVTVSTGVAFAYPPFVLLKCTDGSLPGESSVWAIFDASTNQLTLKNRYSVVKTVKWFAFAEL